MSNPTELPDLDLNELEAIALAATPGPWKGDRYDGTIKYDLLGKDDETVIHGDNGNSDHGPFGIENEEDANYLLAFHPETVLALIALARRAKPEGEAPQAGKVKVLQAALAAALDQDVPAATLSPLCGAQHAESGKEVAGQRDIALDLIHYESEDGHTLVRLDKVKELLAAQQAAAPVGPLINEGTSAPGTPEARYKWFRDWYLRGGLRMEINPWGHVQVTTAEMVDKAIDAAIQRAAQLDGGQEGSESNG